MVEQSTIIPLLNAQQLGMSALAHGAAVMPEMAQATAKELALNLLRQESRQVQKPEKSTDATLVDEEGGGSNGGTAGFRAGTRRSGGDAEAGDKQDDAPSSASPLVGNLLNVKV